MFQTFQLQSMTLKLFVYEKYLTQPIPTKFILRKASSVLENIEDIGHEPVEKLRGPRSASRSLKSKVTNLGEH